MNNDNELDNNINITLNNDNDLDNEIITKTFKFSSNWVPDESADKCLNCKKMFGIFLRKHHCRLCGYIFCYKCLQFSQKIPKEMLPVESLSVSMNDYLSGTQYDEKRICISCNDLMTKIKQVDKIVKTFEIIELDIMELNKAFQKNTFWKDAAEICINKLKNIHNLNVIFYGVMQNIFQITVVILPCYLKHAKQMNKYKIL